MPYIKNVWVDEVLSGDARYNIKENDDSAFKSNMRVELATSVVQAGTPVDADKMNNIEEAVEDLDLEVNGDVIDYSATSTITGWSSFTTKYIAYKRIGNLVFVQFYLDGTSNATSVSFTLPDTNGGGASAQIIARARDNGTWSAGLATLAAAASTVNGFTTPAGGAWTASGTKSLIGQLWFETA